MGKYIRVATGKEVELDNQRFLEIEKYGRYIRIPKTPITPSVKKAPKKKDV